MQKPHLVRPAASDRIAWRDYLSRPRDGWKHDQNSWQTYLTVHEGRLQQLPTDFFLANQLKHDWADVVVLWEGDLIFADGLEIHVHKNQIVLPGQPAGPHVQTDEYSYQVLRRVAREETKLWRYDNIGQHGHPTKHHLHFYQEDGLTDEIVHVGEEGWPTLGDVIDDLYQWWLVHRGAVSGR